MATATRQLLATTYYDTDGTTTVWDFSFSGGYLDKAHVKAYTQSALGVRTVVEITLGMFLGPYQLEITPALATGNVLVIYRDTPKTAPLVDFADGSGFTEISLDTTAKQAVFIGAEADDAANSDVIQELFVSLQAGVNAAEGFAQDAEASAASIAADIAAETAARIAADSGLVTAINGEADLRLAADVSLGEEVNYLIAQVADLATADTVLLAADTALDGRLDTLEISGPQYTYNPTYQSLRIGNSTGATGLKATAVGLSASGIGSLASGNGSLAMSGGHAIGYGALSIGKESIAAGEDSRALQGGYTTAYQSSAVGAATVSRHIGKHALGSGKYIASEGEPILGSLQKADILLTGSTAGATVGVLTSDAYAPAANNQVGFILVSNGASLFRASLIGLTTAGVAFAETVEGVLYRSNTTGIVTLSGVTKSTLISSATLASQLSANNTLQCLTFGVMGATGLNISWLCHVATTEIISP